MQGSSIRYPDSWAEVKEEFSWPVLTCSASWLFRLLSNRPRSYGVSEVMAGNYALKLIQIGFSYFCSLCPLGCPWGAFSGPYCRFQELTAPTSSWTVSGWTCLPSERTWRRKSRGLVWLWPSACCSARSTPRRHLPGSTSGLRWCWLVLRHRYYDHVMIFANLLVIFIKIIVFIFIIIIISIIIINWNCICAKMLFLTFVNQEN